MTPLELFALGCVVAAALVALHAVARALGRPGERTSALTLVVAGQALYLLTEVGAEGVFGLAVEPSLSPRVTLPLFVVALAAQGGGGALFVRWWRRRDEDGDAPGGVDRPSQQ